MSYARTEGCSIVGCGVAGWGVWTHADEAAAKVAEAQRGVVHRSTLSDLGLTDSMIDRRVRIGMLRRLRPSVYSFAGTPRTAEQEMVMEALSVDATAAVSHDSAAYIWGLTSKPPDRVHVIVRRWRREHRSGCIVHESLDFAPRDRVWDAGIPVTHPDRTIVDLGATSPWLVERALSSGLRSGVLDLEGIERFVARVARRGRRGVGVIRPFLEVHRTAGGATESVLEDMFLRILQERGVPLPEPQFEVVDETGWVVCRADFAYPDRMTLIELDGRAYHSDSADFEADRKKQNTTQALGWRTLRFTWSDLVRDPDRTGDTVLAWLRATAPTASVLA